jgi:DMSO/TMAO reductase YedYZ molybdopterin-dependent catalytic subunit
MPSISRGFRRRDRGSDPTRLPPGQHLESAFPVLSAGPTPRVSLAEWSFSITGDLDGQRRWSWEELRALDPEAVRCDIHCVTSWSKLDTEWEGISLDVLFDGVETDAAFATAWCDGGYTTNLPLEDLIGGKAWLAWGYDGRPLPPEHGGPVRLLVPHLYFWKSAKWVRGLVLRTDDEPGFWEQLGYHDRGDPWREQRYQGD